MRRLHNADPRRRARPLAARRYRGQAVSRCRKDESAREPAARPGRRTAVAPRQHPRALREAIAPPRMACPRLPRGRLAAAASTARTGALPRPRRTAPRAQGLHATPPFGRLRRRPQSCRSPGHRSPDTSWARPDTAESSTPPSTASTGSRPTSPVAATTKSLSDVLALRGSYRRRSRRMLSGASTWTRRTSEKPASAATRRRTPSPGIASKGGHATATGRSACTPAQSTRRSTVRLGSGCPPAARSPRARRGAPTPCP